NAAGGRPVREPSGGSAPRRLSNYEPPWTLWTVGGRAKGGGPSVSDEAEDVAFFDLQAKRSVEVAQRFAQELLVSVQKRDERSWPLRVFRIKDARIFVEALTKLRLRFAQPVQLGLGLDWRQPAAPIK